MIHSEKGTREVILETARELFHQNGYGATSMADILQKSGVSSSSLYHFFPSKDELLLEVVNEYDRLLWPAILEQASQTSDRPLDKVVAVLEVYRTLIQASDFQLGCPVGNLALEVGSAKEDARQRIAEVFTKWKEAVQAWISQGLPGRSSLEHSQLASLVLTLVEGAILQARAERSLEAFDAAAKQLGDYLALLESRTP